VALAEQMGWEDQMRLRLIKRLHLVMVGEEQHRCDHLLERASSEQLQWLVAMNLRLFSRRQNPHLEFALLVVVFEGQPACCLCGLADLVGVYLVLPASMMFFVVDGWLEVACSETVLNH
jgi:hypothetical protein